jgi:hypothetical protein
MPNLTKKELKEMRREHPEYFLPWGGLFSITNEQVDELRKKHPQTHPHANAVNAITVSGSTGNLYIVQQSSNGRWSCTCKGYQNHKHCYHLDDLRKEGKIK